MPKKNKSTSKSPHAPSDKCLPLNPNEAIDWLKDAIAFLCGEIGKEASKSVLRLAPRIRRRFVGNALRAWMKARDKDNLTLTSLLGITRREIARRGRPSLSPEIKTEIAKMLPSNVPHKEIAKALSVSKRAVDRVSEQWNAMAWQGQETADLRDLSKIPEGQLSEVRKKMRDKMVEDFTKREGKVRRHDRAAIIEGVAKTIDLDIKPFDDSDKRTPQERAWFMAATGYSSQEIAQELKMSPACACHLVEKERLARYRKAQN
jgi:hypothetical protein